MPLPKPPRLNALLLAYKPAFLSSNAFLTRLKRHYGIKKAGFSGTLDPFAQGSLLIATGSYTKLLPLIPTEPKVYEATLWLGVESSSLDIERARVLGTAPSLDEGRVREVVEGFCGEIPYTPPSFSAKRVRGRRAYELARMGEEVELASTSMYVYTIEFLHYRHPFITFRASVSKGAYIRSLGALIAQGLESRGALSALRRVSEGGLAATPHRLTTLDPLAILPYPSLPIPARYKETFFHGRSLCTASFREMLQQALPLGKAPLDSQTLKKESTHLAAKKKHDIQGDEARESGIYIVQFEEFFSIIQLHQDGSASYLLNRIDHAHTL